ncbi:BrnA antitoxin family protein [Maritalea porphyrae]|uniref:BrnA antitoxin family protein n=1 Tax=Maritalea porphyrae TaxID=880732 RepID=UPI0022AFFA0F|nr:BrnA antitoxin family protein [Maritalea porphyrae]MCZ4274015.1 BrnA antitoxin family protein [Maritalea porphyrae]
MASKKPDPFAIDEDNKPLSDEQVAKLRPGKDVLAELGVDAPEPKKRGRPVADNPKQSVTLRLDAKVLEHFRATGKGWQTRVNETLRKAIGE